MKINDIIINASCEEVVYELQRQLQINNIPLLHKIQDSGSNLMIQCPYHGNGQERKPSAGILKEDGTFHCFACGEVHTLPEVVSYCFGKDDLLGKWGMGWIMRNFATVSIEERKDVELDISRERKQPQKEAHKYVSEDELDSYRYYHKYWTQRGIIDDDIIELFDLGYDVTSQCITFPVRDIDGNCLFVARRNVSTKWFNYPKDVDKPLYGLYELHYTGMHRWVDKLYITESMIDCILLWQAEKCAVALNGTGSKEQIEELRKLPIRQYVLATDNDEAGKKARQKLRKALSNKIITEIDFPKDIKDIGECTKEQIENIERWEVF